MIRLGIAVVVLLLSGCAAGEPSEAERAVDAAARAEIAAHPGDYINGHARAVTVSRNGQVHGLIWGTMHTGYNETTILPAPIRSKFADAVDLTVETVFDNLTPEHSRQLFAPCGRAGRQANPAALKAMDPDVREAVDALRLATGKPEEFSLLGLTYAVSAQHPDLSRTGLPTGSSPDIVLTRAARDRHLPIHVLERPEMQVALLCSDPNGPVAAMQLRLAVRRQAQGDPQRSYYRSSYEAGHIAEIVASGYWLADKQDLEPIGRSRDMMLSTRNPRMAARISSTLEEPGLHFVAVGAGHLIGRDGLVALLQRDGWTVTPCPSDRC